MAELGLEALGHRVAEVHRLVIPTALVAGLGEDLAQGPEATYRNATLRCVVWVVD
jgi:hypothetical protein